ncbi:putative small auxin-up RNA [Helianthus annuus]|nr:putative small auxin-up RNA [Helianthus annuus]
MVLVSGSEPARNFPNRLNFWYQHLVFFGTGLVQDRWYLPVFIFKYWSVPVLNHTVPGEERRRFVVPTGYLSHPLFKMLLEKSSEEFGFGQKNGLVVPCSVNAFQEVVSAVESSNGKCDLSHLVEEFL